MTVCKSVASVKAPEGESERKLYTYVEWEGGREVGEEREKERERESHHQHIYGNYCISAHTYMKADVDTYMYIHVHVCVYLSWIDFLVKVEHFIRLHFL